MNISVVIATYNRRDSLRDCLATLLDQTLPAQDYEIVVVVDGSSDGTVQMLRALKSPSKLVVVEQENQGQTAALNAGAGVATGDILLFLDDDLICDRELVAFHLRAHQHQNAALVFGRMQAILERSATLADRLMHENLEKYYSRLDSNPEPRWPDDAWAGPNCSMPRDVFLEAGGYDEKLFPRRGEDVDLGLRLWKLGLDFVFEPRAITSHRFVKSGRQFWKDAEADGTSLVALGRKHPEMRCNSSLLGCMNGPAPRSLATRLLAGVPVVTKPSFIVLRKLCEQLGRISFAHRIAKRVLMLSEAVATLSGARREAGSWDQLEKLFGSRLLVLLYHHVGFPTPEHEMLALTIPPKQFERQVRWLYKRGYSAITTSQWLGFRARGEPLPDKPILLTFDDAYSDIDQYALPVLEKYGFGSVVFVITGKVGHSTEWDGKPVMTFEQIRHWAARGVEIGGHSRTHPNLTGVSDDALKNEIAGSKADLVAEGLAPFSFAYPYGYFDGRVGESVNGSFPLAFTCEEGLNDLSTNPLFMKRTMVKPGDTLFDIELRAAFGRSYASDFVGFLRSRVRFRTRLRKGMQRLKLLPK